MGWRIATRNQSHSSTRKICSSNFLKCMDAYLFLGQLKGWKQKIPGAPSPPPPPPPHTHRCTRFLAFLLHILAKNDSFLNLQVTIRRFSRRKLKILLPLIKYVLIGLVAQLMSLSQVILEGQVNSWLLWLTLKIELYWLDSRVIPSNMKTTVLVLKFA